MRRQGKLCCLASGHAVEHGKAAFAVADDHLARARIDADVVGVADKLDHAAGAKSTPRKRCTAPSPALAA